MKRVIRNSGLCLLLTIIFLSGPLHAQEKKSEKALLWKISGNALKEPSYLFGTYHLLGEKFLEEVPETKKPFAQAKGVVVETVLDSSRMVSLTMTNGMMKNKKISMLLSKQDFALVDSMLQASSGYTLAMFDSFKPIQVGILISLLETQRLNGELLRKYAGTPLDIYFARTGEKTRKTVTALEPLELQFDILYNHFTEEEQANQLVDMVKKHGLVTKVSAELFTLYIQKDIQGLARLMESSDDFTGNIDHLVKDRNRNWVTVLPGLMKSGSQFIAVGAGHLPGPDGLIELLKKEGFTVIPVTQ